jgi:deazaflavin-dependent oxidoreductase (nitroreductase family)
VKRATKVGWEGSAWNLGGRLAPPAPKPTSPARGMPRTVLDVASGMDFNPQIIDTFRSNAGEVNEPIPFGKGLVLVHVPKKDGTTRIAPVAAIQDDGAWHVVASAGGSPKNPAWVYGLRRAEQVDIEIPGEPVETVRTKVEELTGESRDAMWARFKELSSGFAGYEKTAEGRVFPIFRLQA